MASRSPVSAFPEALGTLPAGWSGPSTFTCALVATGSGCVLNLTYAPTALDSGVLVINYLYVDNAGLSKAPGGSLSIPYEAIAQNNVVATVSPAGQIDAAVGGGMQSVSINFTTDTDNATTDKAATNLAVTTNLAALPAGWTSVSPGFSCAIVSSGSGCQLVLTYAPTAAGRGTLTLDYSYTDDSGAARTGQINIPYSNTSADIVVATASPTGQINAAEKSGSQAVAVTFTTDDGKAAANLTIISGLTTLPAGWRSASGTFSCASVSTGNGCQLGLTYAPTALGSGTLTLGYAYTDDTGSAQTGTFNLAYAATTNDNVVATPSPSGQINAVVAEGSQTVSVVFTTDDGRLATALQLTSNLDRAALGLEQHGEFLRVRQREQRQRLRVEPDLQAGGGGRRNAHAELLVQEQRRPDENGIAQYPLSRDGRRHHRRDADSELRLRPHGLERPRDGHIRDR